MESENAYSDYISSLIQLKNLLYIAVFSLLLKIILEKTRRDPRYVKLASKLPGPTPIPIFGNSIRFLLDTRKGIAQQQVQYTKKYGSMYRLWIGKQLVVCISNAEHIKEVVQSNKTLNKGKVTIPFARFWGYGVFNNEGDLWRSTRKREQPFFIKSAVTPFIPEINDLVYKYVERMKKHVNGPETDVKHKLSNLAFSAITRTQFDHEIDPDDNTVVEFQDGILRAIHTVGVQMFFPQLETDLIIYLINKLILHPIKSHLQQLTKKVISKKLTRVQEIEKTSGKYEPSLLSSSYIAHKDTGSDEILLNDMLTILATGTETTGTTNSFALLMLAIHQDIQDKVYKEIHDVFGDDDRHPSQEDMKRLTYMDQVIRETERRFTLGPAIFKEVSEDIKIGPHIFPAGTAIIINSGSVHMNPDYYPDPQKFNPENFSPEAIAKRPHYSFFAFSGGARVCMGKELADIEVKLTLTAILKTFSIYTPFKMEDIKISSGLVGHSVNGYPIKFKWRKQK